MAGLYFIVKIHTRICWSIRKGRKHYEGGTVTEFDNGYTDVFNLMELEGMLWELQCCNTDVHFSYKPKDTHLHDVFELKTDRELLATFDDMRRKKYRKVNIYVNNNNICGVHASTTSDVDASATENMELSLVCVERIRVDNDTPGPMLKRFIIEKLPSNADVVVDARVSAKQDDYVMSKVELRDLQEELEWAENLEADSGESYHGEGEFFMHMHDMEDLMEDFSDDRFSDQNYGSDNEVLTAFTDSDTYIQILEDEDTIGQIFWRR